MDGWLADSRFRSLNSLLSHWDFVPSGGEGRGEKATDFWSGTPFSHGEKREREGVEEERAIHE